MTDVHCHILPHMDDGSQSVAESLAMLEISAAQGVSRIIATPHFYPTEEDPETFLKRRRLALEELRAVLRPGLPEVCMGAEACYFEGISRSDVPEVLRIERSKLLLLEMPFVQWTKRMLQEIREVQKRLGTTVLLAHVERYWRYQPKDVWDALLDADILCQCNADVFLHWRTRQKALQLLREKKIHLLGSDSHNMSRRPPRLGEALALLGKEDLELLRQNEARFWN